MGAAKLNPSLAGFTHPTKGMKEKGGMRRMLNYIKPLVKLFHSWHRWQQERSRSQTLQGSR